MGKDKPAVIDALKFLVDNDFEVVKVVGPKGDKPVQGGIKLNKVAQNLGIDTVSDDDLYQILATDSSSLKDIDLVISFLFWKKIKKPLIDLPKIACINFHAAPLPEFRGVNGYSFGIYQNLDYWAVSAHMVDESFDTGEIIKVNKLTYIFVHIEGHVGSIGVGSGRRNIAYQSPATYGSIVNSLLKQGFKYF